MSGVRVSGGLFSVLISGIRGVRISGGLLSEVLSSVIQVDISANVRIVLCPPARLGSKFSARCAIDIHRVSRSFVYVVSVA